MIAIIRGCLAHSLPMTKITAAAAEPNQPCHIAIFSGEIVGILSCEIAFNYRFLTATEGQH